MTISFAFAVAVAATETVAACAAAELEGGLVGTGLCVMQPHLL